MDFENSPIVLLDADVLYKYTTRSLIFELAFLEAIKPRWTQEITNEAISNLAKINTNWADNLKRNLKYVQDSFPGSSIGSKLVDGIVNNEGTLHGVHIKDQHVAAAAIVAKADALITGNLRDFALETLTAFGIDLFSPDQFFSQLAKTNPKVLASAIALQLNDFKNPTLSINDYADYLLKAGCSETAKWVQANAGVIQRLTGQ